MRSIRSTGRACARRSPRRSTGARPAADLVRRAQHRRRGAEGWRACRRQADDFLRACRERYGLSIAGLMCIPPFNEPPAPHFALTAKIAARHGLKLLSMGMSADFATAIAFGATHVRVGTAIFGTRELIPRNELEFVSWDRAVPGAVSDRWSPAPRILRSATGLAAPRAGIRRCRARPPAAGCCGRSR